MDLVSLPAWSLHQAAVVAPPRDLCCEHAGAAAWCPLHGFLLLLTSAAKPLSLFIVRPYYHHLPLLSLSPDLGAGLCSFLQRPTESHPTHGNSPTPSLRNFTNPWASTGQVQIKSLPGAQQMCNLPATISMFFWIEKGMLPTDKSYPQNFCVNARLKNKYKK